MLPVNADVLFYNDFNPVYGSRSFQDRVTECEAQFMGIYGDENG